MNDRSPLSQRDSANSTEPLASSRGWLDLSRGDLAGDDGGVFADPVEERRLALAEEVDADEVQPRGDGAGPFLVDREAELVERAREADPGLVVGPKATAN